MIQAREECENEKAALVKIDSYEMWIFVTTVVGMLSSVGLIGRIVWRLSESVNRRRTDTTMAERKGTKGQTTIYKTLYIKLKIE